MRRTLRLLFSVLFFPLAAAVLGWVWQTRHPEGFWRADAPTDAGGRAP